MNSFAHGLTEAWSDKKDNENKLFKNDAYIFTHTSSRPCSIHYSCMTKENL